MPYLGTTAFFLTIGLTLLLATLAYWLLLRAVFPRLIEGSAARLAARPVLVTTVGLVGCVTGVLVVVLLLALPIKAPGLVLGTLLAAGVLGAGVVTAERVGASLPRRHDESWTPTLRGGLILLAASHLPMVGWFLLAPLSLAAGSGAVLIHACAWLFAPFWKPGATLSVGTRHG